MSDGQSGSEPEERTRVLEDGKRLIARIDDMQRVGSHLRAGGSYEDEMVQSFLAREDDDWKVPAATKTPDA